MSISASADRRQRHSQSTGISVWRTGSMNTPSWSPDGKRIAFVSNTDIGGQLIIASLLQLPAGVNGRLLELVTLKLTQIDCIMQKTPSSRREFLRQPPSSHQAASYYRSSSGPRPTTKVRDIGIQLYTVRERNARRPTSTLKQLAAIGFKELESAQR